MTGWTLGSTHSPSQAQGRAWIESIFSALFTFEGTVHNRLRKGERCVLHIFTCKIYRNKSKSIRLFPASCALLRSKLCQKDCFFKNHSDRCGLYTQTKPGLRSLSFSNYINFEALMLDLRLGELKKPGEWSWKSQRRFCFPHFAEVCAWEKWFSQSHHASVWCCDRWLWLPCTFKNILISHFESAKADVKRSPTSSRLANFVSGR